MKVAVIGSRSIIISNIDKYINETDEIVSGGAKGVDSCAEKYARENGLKLKIFLPEYDKFGRAAPLLRNKLIVDYADKIVAFWDGSSKRTASVIKYARQIGKPCEVIICEKQKMT